MTAERASELAPVRRRRVEPALPRVEARRVAEARCVVAPEGVTSAGAVIVDSIEHYAPLNFREAPPSKVYDFTFEAVRAKTDELLAAAVADGVSPTAIPLVEEADPRRIGERYSSWLATRTRATGSAVFCRSTWRPRARQRRRRPARGGRRRKMAGRRSFSTSARTCDTLVVGGGIMGLNIAYQLKRRDPIIKSRSSRPRRRSLERLLDGFQRAYYSFDETMGFALDGINAHKTGRTTWPTRAPWPAETGALWMLGYDEAQNAAMVERLAKFGVGADVLDEAAMGSGHQL